MLWHQRLGHPSDHYLSNAHKFVNGVPKLCHESAVMDTCPTCIKAKLSSLHQRGNTTLVATLPYQGLLIDFLFSGTKSKNDKRRKDYVGINGATSAVVILDHFTGTLVGDAGLSKASPLEWLEDFLQNHSPSCNRK